MSARERVRARGGVEEDRRALRDSVAAYAAIAALASCDCPIRCSHAVGWGARAKAFAPPDPLHEPLAGEHLEVAMRGHRRDVVLARQVGDRHRAALPDPVEDPGAAHRWRVDPHLEVLAEGLGRLLHEPRVELLREDAEPWSSMNLSCSGVSESSAAAIAFLYGLAGVRSSGGTNSTVMEPS